MQKVSLPTIAEEEDATNRGSANNKVRDGDGVLNNGPYRKREETITTLETKLEVPQNHNDKRQRQKVTPKTRSAKTDSTLPQLQ